MTKDRIRGAEMKEVRQTTQEDHLLNVAEAARLLNLAPGTIYHMVHSKRLPVVKVSSRCIRFRKSELLRWIETLSEPAEHQDS
jgi:excisionase family DNA binding protein